jgi:hypothetical protein
LPIAPFIAIIPTGQRFIRPTGLFEKADKDRNVLIPIAKLVLSKGLAKLA